MTPESTPESLVVQYTPWIKKIARRMCNKFQGYYSYEDLLGIAYIAAIEAEKTFDPDIGKFAAYIKPRVEGAIIRSVSNITSYQHKELIKMYTFIDHYIAENNLVPSQQIIMQHLNISAKDFTNLINATSEQTVVSVDNISEEETAIVVDVDMLAEFDSIMALIKTLPRDQQKRIKEFLANPDASKASIKETIAIIRDRLDIKEN